MNEIEVTMKISLERIYEILSDLSDADTVKLIKRLAKDLSESSLDDLEKYIERL